VATIDDHDLAYASPESLSRLAFWLDAQEEDFEWTPGPGASAELRLARLTSWLAASGGDLLYVNLTPADMAHIGLYTARVVVPGFQPIDFGWKERRLGGTRLYRLPVSLGLRPSPVSWDDLNHDPHPLA
jgi:ribosomal protein S12 methylthiotransferase accessory factor